MKNVTITMDETVARWARISAAERDISLSRFLGDFLKERMVAQDEYHQAMLGFLATTPEASTAGKPLPTREEVHDRAALRR